MLPKKISDVLLRSMVNISSRFYKPSIEAAFPKTPSTETRIVANSIPKAGTHLLKSCLRRLHLLDTGQHLDINWDEQAIRTVLEAVAKGAFVTAHLPYKNSYLQIVKELDFKTFLIIRDPRDTVVSYAHYVTKTKSHYLHHYFKNLPDHHQRLMASISGIPNKSAPGNNIFLMDIGTLYRCFTGWFDSRLNRTVRFENLIGLQGNGDRDTQFGEIRCIAEHLSIELSPAQIEQVADKVFDPKSSTFRKGIIGDWKNQFSPEHKQAFKEVAGQLLIDLGYETDFDW